MMKQMCPSMKSHIVYIFLSVLTVLVIACTEEDSFTTSATNELTFSADTIKMDTTFSTVPTVTKTVWVYNRSGDGIRCANVRLKNGNQTGFRVNVDGIYLGKEAGYQVNDIEVRNKDSIRVFVELTSAMNQKEVPTLVEDDLVFTLESGRQQSINLRAFSWDADIWHDVEIAEDRTIASTKPIVIYGGMTVKEGATLTIAAGTTLYFHQDAALNVAGRLVTQGTAEKNVVLRGDRIDHMFDYLPYDRVPGQWQGVHFTKTSFNNELNYTDIHSAYDGIVCDSSGVEQPKLKLYNSVVHNCQGYGLLTYHNVVDIYNTQLSNVLENCLCVIGGKVSLRYCTLAQFYPFDARRGEAIVFANFYGESPYPLEMLEVRNCIITGYKDDELLRIYADDVEEHFLFDHCLIRTPEVKDDERMTNNIYEDPEDHESGSEKNFLLMDIDNLIYDFRLATGSKAIGAAAVLPDTPFDRLGVARPAQPSMGAYEYVAPPPEPEKEEKPET